jgi:hypothetical protein
MKYARVQTFLAGSVCTQCIRRRKKYGEVGIETTRYMYLENIQRPSRNKQLLCIHAVLIGHQSFSYRKGEGLFEGIANNNNNNNNNKQTKNKNKTKRKNIILQCHPLC